MWVTIFYTDVLYVTEEIDTTLKYVFASLILAIFSQHGAID